jgi:hypothetical protein
MSDDIGRMSVQDRALVIAEYCRQHSRVESLYERETNNCRRGFVFSNNLKVVPRWMAEDPHPEDWKVLSALKELEQAYVSRLLEARAAKSR